MHEKYQLYLNRGQSKVQALTAISRKLLAIIYAMARDNRPYIENYEVSKRLQLKEVA